MFSLDFSFYFVPMGLVPGWSERFKGLWKLEKITDLMLKKGIHIIVNIYIFMILNMSIKKKENYLEHCYCMYR